MFESFDNFFKPITTGWGNASRTINKFFHPKDPLTNIEVKQSERVGPTVKQTKTQSSTPANTQSQEPKVNASPWNLNKTSASTPTRFEYTITNDNKSILQKLLKYQIEGVRKILEDNPELSKLSSGTTPMRNLNKEFKDETEKLSKELPQQIKLDKIKKFFKEVGIEDENGSYKIKTSKEVFDKISATDIAGFSSKIDNFEKLKLLQKNFETFNLYTLQLYKSENIKSDSENFKRTGEAKKESDELTSKIHALKFINISYYYHLTSSTSLIPTETFVFNLTKALNEFNQSKDKSTTSELNKPKENNSTASGTNSTKEGPVVNWNDSRGQAHPTPSSSPIRDSKNVSVLPPSSLSDDLLGPRIDSTKYKGLPGSPLAPYTPKNDNSGSPKMPKRVSFQEAIEHSPAPSFVANQTPINLKGILKNNSPSP